MTAFDTWLLDSIADAVPEHYADPEAAELAEALAPLITELLADARVEGYKQAAADSRSICSRAGGCF